MIRTTQFGTGSVGRMRALVIQELFITRRSLEIFMDILFFPLMNVLLFGLITTFISDIRNATTGLYLVLGSLFWQVISINQYNVTVSSMWSVWSHNLTNLFIAPISLAEYLISHIIAAVLRTAFVIAVLAFGVYVFFDFNVLHLGIINNLLFFGNLSLFAWWIGIILLGLIFRFGTRIQAIAWGVIFLFQPITASFFPVHVLPPVLQTVAHALPATYVFESIRAALANGGTQWRFAAVAFILNSIYTVVAVVVFGRLFRRSKETGQFARNDL